MIIFFLQIANSYFAISNNIVEVLMTRYWVKILLYVMFWPGCSIYEVEILQYTVYIHIYIYVVYKYHDIKL